MESRIQHLEVTDGVRSLNGSVAEADLEVPAIIMAGGFGTRLKDLTRNTPKPMIKVAGRPTLERIVEHLSDNGIRKAAMALHFLPQVIQDHFGSGGAWGMKLRYSVAPEDYGTAGSVLRASRFISGNPVVVVSGDVLDNFDLEGLVREHIARGSRMTIGLTKVTDPTQYGVAILDENDRLQRFVEKPKTWPEPSCWVNAGIYVIDRSILARIPDRRFYDFSRDLIPLLLKEGVEIVGRRLEGHWFDIGTPETLAEANAFYRRMDILPGLADGEAAAYVGRAGRMAVKALGVAAGISMGAGM